MEGGKRIAQSLDELCERRIRIREGEAIMRRRRFISHVAATAMAASVPCSKLVGFEVPKATSFAPANPDEDVFAYLKRTSQRFDLPTYKRLLGAANEFKEGDEIVGVAAVDFQMRTT